MKPDYICFGLGIPSEGVRNKSDTIARFEIRKGIKGHEKHSAMLQAGYDTQDRMATLFGEITFGELLTQSFKEWIPRVLPNIDLAASYGLIDEPETVKSLFERMLNA